MIKIYALVDPISNEIRYVGQTYRKLDVRLKEHVYDCIRRPRSSHKVNWIKSLISKNQIPNIKLLETVNSLDVVEKEKYWMDKLSGEGNNLTNTTKGGEFCTRGSTLSEDIREHMSEKAKERSKGKGNTMWGKKHRDSSKEKMSERKKGLYDGINNPRSREVFEYDEYNNFVRKWSHCKECATYHSISRGNLSTFAKINTELENGDSPIKKYKMLKNIIFKFN